MLEQLTGEDSVLQEFVFHISVTGLLSVVTEFTDLVSSALLHVPLVNWEGVLGLTVYICYHNITLD